VATTCDGDRSNQSVTQETRRFRKSRSLSSSHRREGRGRLKAIAVRQTFVHIRRLPFRVMPLVLTVPTIPPQSSTRILPESIHRAIAAFPEGSTKERSPLAVSSTRTLMPLASR